jgi:hypothetical protein
MRQSENMTHSSRTEGGDGVGRSLQFAEVGVIVGSSVPVSNMRVPVVGKATVQTIATNNKARNAATAQRNRLTHCTPPL